MNKLVIMARGLGTRMRKSDDAAAIDGKQSAMADAGIKALIPVDLGGDSRPFLDYVLLSAASAGYRRVCLVIGPEQEAIRQYYGGSSLPNDLAGLTFDFAEQPEARGTADAVASAEAFAGNDPFAVINSDNYYPIEALRGLRQAPGCAVALFERDAMLAGSNVPPERILKFAVARIDSQNRLSRIHEKPDEALLASLPRPLWLSMNCWRFGPSIFEAARAIPPSPRGEYEITDAVQYAIDVLGEPFHVVPVHAPVLDMTSRGDIAKVAALLTAAEKGTSPIMTDRARMDRMP